ncbi:MAG: FAD-binding protein, partial [Alphaproteobacteria bacterium]|nr:FAD-binding protein [Alphaproteobacteria bacterium]
MSEAARHAVIAGAGPSGLSAALALAQAGWRVSVIEQAPVMEDVGAGLQISPNASRLLQHLGVLEHLRPLASEPQALRIRRGKDAAVLATLPLGAQAHARWGAPSLVVHRADLQRALLECVARAPLISLKTGTRIMGFGNQPDSIEIGAKMGLIGIKLSADLLIGADGLRSLVRERLGLLPNDQPLYSGRIAWRALVPSERVPDFARAPETNLWLGTKTHLVHYPLRNGALINLVAITQDHWRAQDEPDLWSSLGAAQDVQAR